MARTDAPTPVRVEVLGPLRLFVDGAAVDVPGPKRRAVLALLALAEGRTVTVDSLVDALWPSGIPESGRQAVHTHVSRLRGHLGPAANRLETRPEGYRLDLARGDLDVLQARAALAAVRSGTPPDPVSGLTLLEEAHALWRGPVLADLTEIEAIAAAAEGCAQLHREVIDALIATAISSGRADTVLGLAGSSMAADPLREPAVLLQMRALAAAGQAPDAMRIGRQYRHRLADETGLDPSPALGALERDIAEGKLAAAPVQRTGPVQMQPSIQPEPPVEPEPSVSQELLVHPEPAVGPEPAVQSGHEHQPKEPARRQAAARPTTRLIGRDAQVASLHRLLASERLVTIVGPGGVGKTRVALEVAHGSSEAKVLLLAPVTDPSAIPHAVAAALDLTVVQDDVLAACIAALADRSTLLVVDNCEHLLDSVRDTIDVLLAGCPALTVLATSREPLGLPAEYASRLAPLALPEPDHAEAATQAEMSVLEDVPSVAVFLDRAAKVRAGTSPTGSDLRLVADIVRRLDGMPLAIELAAGRLSTFSLADLSDRLDRSLDLLGGGRPTAEARHRTLRATIEWSYGLLTADEQRLFRHLSVFVDGVDLPTAERLAADLGLDSDPGSVLARLVDASMIDAVFDGGTRYRMLETVRAFGADQLRAAGEDDGAAALLVDWAVELTTDLAGTMETAKEPEADACFRREIANLRAAWRLARSRDDIDAAAAMVIALFDCIAYRDLVEVRGWAEELAADPALRTRPLAAPALGTAAEAAYQSGDYPRAEQLAHAGLQLVRDDAYAWYCLMPLSVAALARGAYTEVVEHALAASASLTGRAREHLGIAALATAYAGDLPRARTLNEQGLAMATAPSMLSWGTYVAGEIENAAGRHDVAEEHYARAIDLARSAGATFLGGVATVGLLTVRAAGGRITEALRGYREVIDYFAQTGNWTHQWATLRNLATLLRELGDETSATVLEAAANSAADAPADDRVRQNRPTPVPDSKAMTREAVLEVARRAIDRHVSVDGLLDGRLPG